MRRVPPQLTSYAKANRRKLTDEEAMLWAELKRLRASGIRFRRQVPIGNFIVDFACLRAKLVVELDGVDHADRVRRDEERDGWLTSQGYRVMRYGNFEIVRGVEIVVDDILRALVNATGDVAFTIGIGVHAETK